MKRFTALLSLSLLLNTAPLRADEVRLFSWSDYFGAKPIAQFSEETGTKVIYDVFDNNDIVETKLLAGGSGYDVVTPNLSPHFARQLAAKVWADLDPAAKPPR